MKKLIFFFITTIFLSCATEEQIAYNKIKNSNSIEELNNFVINYSTNENIETVIYRLRVLEFQQIKKDPKPIYLRHFLTRYKRGKDVDQIREIWFNQRFEAALKSENREKELSFLHHDFSEKIYQDKIVMKLYLFERERVLKSENYDEIALFLKKYPTSDISIELQKRLEKIELKTVLDSGDLDRLQKFINRNPQYLSGDIEYRYHELLFNKYKDSPLIELERFLENNPKNHFYTQLREILVDKKYRWNLAFFDAESLFDLDSKEKILKFAKDIEWVKKNKDSVDKSKEILNKLLSQPQLEEDIEFKIYDIPEDTIKDGDLIIKMPFFVKDLSLYTKKGESKFILTYLSTLVALDIYYNQNLEANYTIFKEKIDFFSKIDDPYSLRKKLMFYFVIDDEVGFKETLSLLTEKEDKNIFFRFLRFYFFEEAAIENYLSELKKVVDDSISIINSEKAIYKNRVDHSIELYFIDKIVKYILLFYRERKIVLNQNIVENISKIKNIGEKGSFDKEICKFYSNLKKDKIELFNQLKNLTTVKSELENYLFLNLPVKNVKKELKNISIEKFKNNCFYNENRSNWCEKKEKLFSILEFCEN